MSLLLSTNCERSLFNVLHWDAWTYLSCVREGRAINISTDFTCIVTSPTRLVPVLLVMLLRAEAWRAFTWDMQVSRHSEGGWGSIIYS